MECDRPVTVCGGGWILDNTKKKSISALMKFVIRVIRTHFAITVTMAEMELRNVWMVVLAVLCESMCGMASASDGCYESNFFSLQQKK